MSHCIRQRTEKPNNEGMNDSSVDITFRQRVIYTNVQHLNLNSRSATLPLCPGLADASQSVSPSQKSQLEIRTEGNANQRTSRIIVTRGFVMVGAIVVRYGVLLRGSLERVLRLQIECIIATKSIHLMSHKQTNLTIINPIPIYQSKNQSNTSQSIYLFDNLALLKVFVNLEQVHVIYSSAEQHIVQLNHMRTGQLVQRLI